MSKTELAFSYRELDRHAAAHDASHFLLIPEAVAKVAEATDVAKYFAYANKARKSVTFRSGGTSLSGQGITDSLQLDVRRAFRDIEVLDEGKRVRVQPGATVRHVNNRLLRFGRKLGPDPASEIAATVGGVISNNSSGMACGTKQNTYQTLESLTFILPSGTKINTADSDADEQLRLQEPEIYAGLLRLRERLMSRPLEVEKVRQQFSMKNTMGYGINALVDFSKPIEILQHLIIGSEGTLAFVAEAVFQTVPNYKHNLTGLLLFPDLRSANETLPELVESGATSLELMDTISLRVGQKDPLAHPLIKQQNLVNQVALLVEYQGEDAERLREKEAKVTRELQKIVSTENALWSDDYKTRADLWQLRKGLYAAVAGARPSGTTALLEDIAVPVPALADTCESLTKLFDEYGYLDSVIFGHAKDGNIHFMITDNFTTDAGLDKYSAFTEEMVELVLSHEGTLKAEHGTGRVMAPFVKRQFGDFLYQIMTDIKQLIDPKQILNPGVIISEDASIHLKNIKSVPEISPEATKCVSCGFCEPVCPSKNLTLTPRQRIVLERDIVDAKARGDHKLVRALNKQKQYDSIDTCAVDGMCQTVCPVKINTGDLVRTLRHEESTAADRAFWRMLSGIWKPFTRGTALALTVTKHIPQFIWQLPNKALRALLGAKRVPLLEKSLPVGGHSRARSSRTGMSNPEHATAKRAQATRQSSETAYIYFPSCSGSMFGAEAGAPGVQSALEHLAELVGVRLSVPKNIDSLCCGVPWSSKGMRAGYDKTKSKTVAAIAEIAGGRPVTLISDATSCTEGLVKMLSAELPEVKVVDAVTFVRNEIAPLLPEVVGKLESVVIHPTCATTRLGITDDLVVVAKLFSAEVHIPDDWGCCGFAGDRGMLLPELTASATKAEAKEVVGIRADAYLSSNRTCEIGMTRATGESYVHVLEQLSLAVSRQEAKL